MADRRHREVPFSYDRLPPHDVEAEHAVIASALVDETAVLRMAHVVKPEDFYRDENRTIWNACLDIANRGEIANQITVAHELARRNRLEDVGGQARMADLVRTLPTSIGCEYYAGIVRRLAQYRGLVQRAYQVAELAYSAPADFEGAYGQAIEFILSAGDGSTGPESDVASASEVLRNGLVDEMMLRMEDPTALQGLPTGLRALDLHLLGWRGGAVYVIAAPSGMGKSLFVQDRILSLALAGHGVLVFTTEMGQAEVAERHIYQLAKLDPYALRQRGTPYTSGERERINNAMDQLNQLPITYCDRGDLSIEYLRATTKRIASRKRVSAVFADHLQEMGTDTNEINRKYELDRIVKGLKKLAREQDIPAMAVSQRNRKDAAGNINESLADSSGIENVADAIMFLRPQNETGDEYLTPDEARIRASNPGWTRFELYISKMRKGTTGAVDLVCDYRAGGRYYSWNEWRRAS